MHRQGTNMFNSNLGGKTKQPICPFFKKDNKFFTTETGELIPNEYPIANVSVRLYSLAKSHVKKFKVSLLLLLFNSWFN